MRRRLCALLLVLAAVGLGCSGDDDSGGGTGADELTVVSLNVLHGAACPPDSDGCRLPDRMALTLRLVEEAGCPDVVALQEVSPRVRTTLLELLPDTCDGKYEEVWVADESIDRELVLTTLTSTAKERRTLAGGMRTALWTRLDTDIGEVDLVVTHLGAGGNSDGTGGGLCLRRTCPPPCEPDMTLHACQLVQLGALLDEKRDDGERPAVVVGDFNLVPSAPPLVSFVRDQDLEDVHVAARQPECDPSTGVGCTGGRADDTLAALTDPASGETERIDYAFVAAGDECDPGYGSGTGLFAHEPSTDGPGGLVWPSDHVGVAVQLRCTER